MQCNISKSFVHSTPRRSQEYLIFKEKSYMKSKNEMSIIVVIKSSDEEEYTGRKVQDDRTFMPSIGPPQILQVTWMWLAQSFSVLGCGIIRVETNNPNSQRCWCFCLLNNQLTSTYVLTLQLLFWIKIYRKNTTNFQLKITY